MLQFSLTIFPFFSAQGITISSRSFFRLFLFRKKLVKNILVYIQKRILRFYAISFRNFFRISCSNITIYNRNVKQKRRNKENLEKCKMMTMIKVLSKSTPENRRKFVLDVRHCLWLFTVFGFEMMFRKLQYFLGLVCGEIARSVGGGWLMGWTLPMTSPFQTEEYSHRFFSCPSL